MRCCATIEFSFAQGWALPPGSLVRSCSASLSFTPRLCLPSSISWQSADYTHRCTQRHARTDPPLPSHPPRARRTNPHTRAHTHGHTTRRSGARGEGHHRNFTCRTCRVRVLVAFDDIPPAVCQAFYALGQLRSSRTPDVIQDFYFYIGIFSLSFEFVQPGCDGGSTDFPTRFQSNVRATLGRGLIAATGT